MSLPSRPRPGRRLAVVASYAPSLVNFRWELLRLARERGHEVLCLAPDFDPATTARLGAIGIGCEGFPLSRTGLNPLEDLASLRALTAVFQRWKPDVVTGYTPKAAVYSALAARRASATRIAPMITGLGYAFVREPGLKRRVVRQVTLALYRAAFRASHAAIFHNRDDHRQLAALGVVPKGLDVRFVGGSGVDLSRFPRAALPGLDGGIVFLSIARLVRYKGIVEYCEAARRVLQSGARARFRLIGPAEKGPAAFTADELRAYAGEVEYLGARDDIAAAIADAHVYVLASYGEGMPRTVLEAMAVGRPIITTDANGCRDTVEEGINGHLVPVRDAEALAEAMRRILTRPDRIPAMADASRARAERTFAVDKVAADTLDALGLS